MNLEDYLIEEKKYILAINKISQVIEESVKENYYNLINGNISRDYLDEIIALNSAIRMVAYGMRLKRKNAYLNIDKNYKDDFDYESVMLESI